MSIGILGECILVWCVGTSYIDGIYFRIVKSTERIKSECMNDMFCYTRTARQLVPNKVLHSIHVLNIVLCVVKLFLVKTICTRQNTHI